MAMSAMAKRIAAKLTSAPARNSLNVTGASGQAAKPPARKPVVSSTIGSMNSGKMDNAQTVGVTSPRKVAGSFGDPGKILNSPTKGIISSSSDKLPSKTGNVSKLGKGVD